jgi:hypothetical protein
MTLPNSPGTAEALADGTAGRRRIGVPSILVDEKGECLDRQSWWRCATSLRTQRDLLSDLDRPIPLVFEAVLLLIRVTRVPRCRRTDFAGGWVGLTVLDVRHPLQGQDGRRINVIARDPGQPAIEIGRVVTDQHRVIRSVRDLRITIVFAPSDRMDSPCSRTTLTIKHFRLSRSARGLASGVGPCAPMP